MPRRKAVRFVPGVPLYRQVQEHIQTMLQRDRGAERLRLTDADLAHRFGVSRITVRKASRQRPPVPNSKTRNLRTARHAPRKTHPDEFS
jgi:hypothetical protein